MRVREPVARPLDVVSVELLLSASQAFLVGVLLYLAVGVWEDQGVAFGPVAVILALLGLAVGGAWLYWLIGGTGWLLAAATTPAAMFLGFTLVLGWSGQDLFEVRGAPMLLATAAAVYGIVCGVFLDSPRRWGWDQRERLRPGTQVPRVSATTRSLVARVPRSLPRRGAAGETPSELVTRIERSSPSGPGAGAPGPSGDVGMPYEREPGSHAVDGAAPAAGAPRDASTPAEGAEPASAAGSTGPAAASAASASQPAAAATRAAADGSMERTAGTTAPPAPDTREPVGATPSAARREGSIELPTSVEPKAQRSPWAWAAPPAWNRDEDDEAPASSSSSRR